MIDASPAGHRPPTSPGAQPRARGRRLSSPLPGESNHESDGPGEPGPEAIAHPVATHFATAGRRPTRSPSGSSSTPRAPHLDPLPCRTADLGRSPAPPLRKWGRGTLTIGALGALPGAGPRTRTGPIAPVSVSGSVGLEAPRGGPPGDRSLDLAPGRGRETPRPWRSGQSTRTGPPAVSPLAPEVQRTAAEPSGSLSRTVAAPVSASATVSASGPATQRWWVMSRGARRGAAGVNRGLATPRGYPGKVEGGSGRMPRGPGR